MNHSIANALVLIMVWVFTVPEARASQKQPDVKKPNIIILLADQWRAQALGYAGDPNVQTPNIDQLERESVNFTHAVAGMPVCSPTRASLLTGQRPQTHGVFINDVPLDPNAVTLAKALKATGYDTGCIGKWHVDGHGRLSFIPPERRQGFDYWKVCECTHDYNRSVYYGDTPEKQVWDGYDAISQTHDAQGFISEHSQSQKPFLLWLAWGPPHNPYETAPQKYRDLYASDRLTLRKNIPTDADARTRSELANYYAHCTALDDCVGGIVRTLKETGTYENTIIVFTADHGDMLHSQGQIRKQRPWEEAVRVPLLIRVPEGTSIKPNRLEATINTEDIMPTLLTLCGSAIPKTVEGLDFTECMKGGKDPSEGATVIRCITPFGEYARKQGGREYRELRTTRYSYARDLNGPWLLYDNQSDPYQLENLVGRPECATLQDKLNSRLVRKLAEQNDAFLPGTTYIEKWGWKVDSSGTAATAP